MRNGKPVRPNASKECTSIHGVHVRLRLAVFKYEE